jgi:hypothetical protein
MAMSEQLSLQPECSSEDTGGHGRYGTKTGSAGVRFINSILRQFGYDSVAEWRAKHLKDGIPGIGGVRPVMQISFVEFRHQQVLS